MVATRNGAGGGADAAATGLPGVIRRVPLLHSDPAQESFDSPIDRRSSYYRAAAAGQLAAAGSRAPQPLLTPPNVLTLLRLALVPAFAACWFGTEHYAVATAAIWIAASLTDWLDGFLARRLAMTSAFGAFLDPVADKVMVSTVLVLLAAQPPPPVSQAAMAAPVVLVVAREIAMSALREWAATSGGAAHRAVKVSSLGKWKTALQMIALSALLVLRNDHLVGGDPATVRLLHRATLAAFGLLWASTALALLSLARYLAAVWHFFRYPGAAKGR